MFIFDDLEDVYMDRRKEWFALQKTVTTPLAVRMEHNGILVGVASIASCWGLSVREATHLLEINRIHPYSTDKKVLYFRPHLWDIHDEYLGFLEKYYPKHIRLQHNLVAVDDVAVFYELSRSNALRVIKSLKLEMYKTHPTAKTGLYDFDKIIQAEERNHSFSKVTFYSGHSSKGSMASGAFIFRDVDCSRYDACIDFAYNTSNHINCKMCKHYIARTKTSAKPSDDLAVFIPRHKASLKRLQEAIAVQLHGDLSLLPNAL